MILGGGKLIRARDLRFEAPVSSITSPAATASSEETLLQENMASVEGQLIVDALSRAGTRQKAAASSGHQPAHAALQDRPAAQHRFFDSALPRTPERISQTA